MVHQQLGVEPRKLGVTPDLGVERMPEKVVAVHAVVGLGGVYPLDGSEQRREVEQVAVGQDPVPPLGHRQDVVEEAPGPRVAARRRTHRAERTAVGHDGAQVAGGQRLLRNGLARQFTTRIYHRERPVRLGRITAGEALGGLGDGGRTKAIIGV